ncbi:hypothetical protein DXG01_016395 [Tephrocybe rancida]|nr:hypothetical protein DXG01_016395 [Tephrocybe rancida]
MTSQRGLPGFGLPLNYYGEPGNKLFSNALTLNNRDTECELLPLTTLREFTMLDIMNKISDKPRWHIKISNAHSSKVFDDAIAQKWKEEILSADGMDVTVAMVEWCIAELRYKAKIFEKTGAVSVFNGDVVKSDTTVPLSLKEALKAAVAPLEQVPIRLQDWHPRSDDKVLDLVHPSLYPLVYGRSRILSDTTVGLDDCIEQSGRGETIPVPPEEETQLLQSQEYSYYRNGDLSQPFSRHFQWLPCDLSLSGNTVKIVSYINNLHPERNRDLYGVIEKIIGHTIPLWNFTLTPLKALHAGGPEWKRISYTECQYNPNPEFGPKTDGPQRGDDEGEDAFYERRQEWYDETRRIVRPEPGPFHPPDFDGEEDLRNYWKRRVYDEKTGELKPPYRVDIFQDFAESGLQIIVKLANIYLTPDKPVYEGGTWHVEGQLNEHICASTIYYYDNDNITDSKLAFRQMSDTEIDIEHEQYHHDWLPEIFGCEPEGPAVQDVGAVATPEGRLLTWPNILQHQVQPFKLVDPTKPGHRKILAFFLVDPNIRIISTANVPCQQLEWWADAIQNKRSSLTELPAEIKEHIIQDVEDFPITLEEAKGMRLKLMDERSVFILEQDAAFHAQEISLCEH